MDFRDFLLDSQNPISPREATAYAYQVTRGLSLLHFLGVLHGNVKPSNILIQNPGGTPHRRILRLIDF